MKVLKIVIILTFAILIPFVAITEIKYHTDSSSNELEVVSELNLDFDYELEDETIDFKNQSDFVKAYRISFEPKYYNSFINCLVSREPYAFKKTDFDNILNYEIDAIRRTNIGKDLKNENEYICYSSSHLITVKHFWSLVTTPLITDVIIDKTKDRVYAYIFVFT